MEILQFKNVCLSYFADEGETNALENISFGVSEGEFVAIVGPSGCGKTTLLSLVSGLIKPKSGEIVLDCDAKVCKREVGYMLQRDHLFEWRSIESNVRLGLEIQKMNTPDNRKFASELLTKYGLDSFRKHYPNQLSGGMRQRVALIRTLAFRPRILLLDEPFSALDYQTRLSVCDDVHAIIKSENKTTLLVTHDLSEALSLADKIIVLTSRPATVKAIYTMDFGASTPLARREDSTFAHWFEKIWKDLKNS